MGYCVVLILSARRLVSGFEGKSLEEDGNGEDGDGGDVGS